MGKIKTLAGETVLYGFGSIVPRMLNFLLVFLHTAVYNPTEYSVITKLYALVAVINIIYVFGLETGYFRFATKPGADTKKIFNLALTAVIIISAGFTILFLLSADSLSLQLDVDKKYIVWFSFIMFIDAVVAIPFARLRLEKKPRQFALGKISNIVILVSLNFYFLKIAYNPEVGVDYVFIANLIANGFYILFFIRTFISWRPVLDKAVLSTMFTYSFPIMLTGIAGMINEMFSRITLEWWLPDNFYPGQTSEYALGVFGACYKFSAIMNLTVQAFRFAAEPFFFSNASEKNSPQLFARINHYFIIVCCFIFLAVTINLDVLKHILRDDAYWEGLNIVPILLLAYLFLGIYYNFTIWFKLTDKTHFGTFITLSGAFITVLFNFLLIPYLGYTGSSLAALLCYLSMTVICYLLGQKFYAIPYRIKSGISYILLTIALAYFINSFDFESQWLATGFHGLVLLFYAWIIYRIERKEFKKSVM